MKSTRHGGILLEMVVAIALIAMALCGVSQLLLIAGKQQHSVERRRLASREAGNVMELVMLREFEEVTSEKLADWTLAPDVRRQLPASRLEIAVLDEASPVARQVQVKVHWHGVSGQHEQLQLVAWKFPRMP